MVHFIHLMAFVLLGINMSKQQQALSDEDFKKVDEAIKDVIE